MGTWRNENLPRLTNIKSCLATACYVLKAISVKCLKYLSAVMAIGVTLDMSNSQLSTFIRRNSSRWCRLGP